LKTAILGGGLTGLTLSYLLNQRGVNFEILEKEDKCGGLMRTLHENGFIFDYGGSHIVFSKDKEVLDFMINLLGDNKVRSRRNTKILYKGRYVKYPFENGLSDLSNEDNFECLYYFIQNLIKKEVDTPKNLKEWCYYTFGKGISEKYLIPYNEKIWKYPLGKMSLEWVERVPNPPVEDIIKSSLGIKTDGYTHQLYFYYPTVGGIHALIRLLEEKINNSIVINFKIKKIKKEDEEWIISNGQKEKIYDKIISTIPIHNLINALNVPVDVKKAVNDLKYNSLITIMIGINKLKINDFTWLYIPDKDILTHRVSFPSNYSSYVVPEGKSSVLAEITCNVGDEIWKMDDNDLIEKTISDLYRLNIISKEDVCFVKVKKTKYAYVINDLDYHGNMKTVKDYMSEMGIDIVGRFSEFKYLNMDDCIRSAMNYAVKMR
jgi:protoporphyrinogen oxidase